MHRNLRDKVGDDMIGKYDIEVISKKVKYSLTIEHNINILRGDSATGKTKLVEMILYSHRKDSPYIVKCEKQVYGFTDLNFDENIDFNSDRYRDTIIFMDEEIDYIKTKEFASKVKKADCYFVLVTREKLCTLPYSCNAIYELQEKNIIPQSKVINNDMHAIYQLNDKPKLSLEGRLSYVIVEDTNSGYEMFKSLSGRVHAECQASKGNSNVAKTLRKRLLKYEDKGILVVVDSAAFGPYYDELRNEVMVHQNVVLFLPESFEYLILSSGLIQGDDLDKKLHETYNYADSKVFLSWEQYYTHLLKQLTINTELAYSKGTLNKQYLHNDNIRAIYNTLPKELGL
jgi:hypothetical protein